MARPPKTQKEISDENKGNLDYFRKRPSFRRLRLISFIVVAVMSAGAVIGFRYYGDTDYFSAGPLSARHARFADHCEVCHAEASPIFVKQTDPDGATPAGGRRLGDAQRLSQVALIRRNLTQSSSLERLDLACFHCHEPQGLHQPQGVSAAIKKVAIELSLVQSGSCSSCHREHQGPGPMKLPDNNNCANCHGNKELQKNLVLTSAGGQRIPPEGLIGDLYGDGVRRFFAPVAVPHKTAIFKSFSGGHPAFGYEAATAKDTAKIRFNHLRHEQADVVIKPDGPPPQPVRKLECADCHSAGPDGAFMKPIRYAEHCSRCHSLQFDPDFPKLLVPHRDAEKVHDFLRSLKSQYLEYITMTSPSTSDAQKQDFINSRFSKLLNTYGSYGKLDEAVFKTGRPALDYEQLAASADRVTAKSNKDQFIIGCNKCHVGVAVSGTADNGQWTIPLTNMAERWLTRGPFTHAPHVHMSCVDCHETAVKSRKTSDILLPSQKSCTDCHRPLDEFKAETAFGKQPAKKTGAELVAQQRTEGGIAADCQSCHPRYHTTEREVNLLEAEGLR